jgi:hypothetical protein
VTHPEARSVKRGYLANVLTLPPLVYPFQYNPTQLTDSKRVEWTRREPTFEAGGIAGLQQGFAKAAAGGGVPELAGLGKEIAGRVFSGAELKKFAAEKERTINFRILIDGRERRPGEPDLRRNDGGDIRADLALLRSFVYPAPVNWLEIVATLRRPSQAAFTELWFKEPPTAVLVLGDMSVEGFVTDLKVTETMFNDQLNPVRAEVEITMIERIDSVTFVLDSLKRIGQITAATAYSDIPQVLL